MLFTVAQAKPTVFESVLAIFSRLDTLAHPEMLVETLQAMSGRLGGHLSGDWPDMSVSGVQNLSDCNGRLGACARRIPGVLPWEEDRC